MKDLISPKITVLMPVYNGEKYLKEAIDSILHQTFTDFEFLIINDGSTDRSIEIIKSYSDSRIRLVHNEKNIKLIATLNKGIKLSRGEYIARMDCDDISLPQRLRKQVSFLDVNPTISVLGSNLIWIDGNGVELSNQPASYPCSPGVIKWKIFFRCCIQHPTVIVRKDVYSKLNGYNKSSIHVEDYDLWLKASLQYRMANLPEKLLLYRIHSNRISVKNQDLQKNNTFKIVSHYVSKLLGKDITGELFHLVSENSFAQKSSDLNDAFSLLFELCKKIIVDETITQEEKIYIQKDVIKRFFMLSCKNKKYFLQSMKFLSTALKIKLCK